MITADNIKFDDDEGRFVMVVDYVGSAQPLTFDIHAIVLEFYDTVRREIGPYAAEADSARAAVRAGVSLADYTAIPQPVTVRPVSVEDAVDAGYALDDPKSEGWHDRMAD